jgi:hypothetical protein
MTPKEAAAKCREWAAYSRSCAIANDDEMISYGHGEREVAFAAAANLIDQVNVPQPWPPPKEMKEILAFNSRFKHWSDFWRGPDRTWDDVNATHENSLTHWLPIPPAPEVKG